MGLAAKNIFSPVRHASSDRVAYSATKASRFSASALSSRFLGRLKANLEIVQAGAAAQDDTAFRDKLPHHFPVPVQFDARHIGQLLHCLLQLRLLFLAEDGGEPPVCSNIKAAGKAVAHLPMV